MSIFPSPHTHSIKKNCWCCKVGVFLFYFIYSNKKNILERLPGENSEMRNMFLNWCKNLWTQWKISCMNQHGDVSKNYIFAYDVLEVGISCFFHKNIGNETTFWFFYLSIDWLVDAFTVEWRQLIYIAGW